MSKCCSFQDETVLDQTRLKQEQQTNNEGAGGSNNSRELPLLVDKLLGRK